MSVRSKRRYRLSPAKRRAFLATPKGQAWLERKIAERRASRTHPGPAPERFTRTKLPFTAMICGEPVEVTREWVRKRSG